MCTAALHFVPVQCTCCTILHTAPVAHPIVVRPYTSLQYSLKHCNITLHCTSCIKLHYNQFALHMLRHTILQSALSAPNCIVLYCIALHCTCSVFLSMSTVGGADPRQEGHLTGLLPVFSDNPMTADWQIRARDPLQMQCNARLFQIWGIYTPETLQKWPPWWSARF